MSSRACACDYSAITDGDVWTAGPAPVRVSARVALWKALRVDGAVTVAVPSILRAWRRQGSDQCFLLVRSSGPRQEVADAVQAAMAHANDLEWEETGGGPQVGASSIVVTPKGPVVTIGFCDSAQALMLWLSRFAAVLETCAVTVRVGPVRSERFPSDSWTGTVLAAAMTVPVDETAVAEDAARRAGATPGWYVPEDVTRRLLDVVVPWLAGRPGRMFFGHGGLTVGVDAAGVAELVVTSLRREAISYVIQTSGPEDARVAVWDQLGQLTLAEGHPDTSWSDDLGSLAEAMTALAPWLEQGLVRRARMPLPVWSQVVNQYPPLPPYPGVRLRGTLLVEARHLTGRFVNDAYGVQVITGAHLAPVGDLSGWDVREVAPDRYLVQARDPAAWFTGDEPDPAVLAAARSDFGDAILTPEAFAVQPPPPWW